MWKSKFEVNCFCYVLSRQFARVNESVSTHLGKPVGEIGVVVNTEARYSDVDLSGLKRRHQVV